jgi:hypothetical protein
MTDELKRRLTDLKNRMEYKQLIFIEKKIVKMDVSKQMSVFKSFITQLSSDIKKSSDEGKYLQSIIKSFDGLSITEIRFALEKSWDIAEGTQILMMRYADNFDESEIKKYEMRAKIMENILTFMVSHNIGEFSEAEKDEQTSK